GQTTLIRNVAIQIDSADEFFEGRRLKDDLALRVCDDARTVEDNPIVAADEVDKYDGYSRHHCAMRHHGAALAHLAFVERRGIDRDQHFSAEFDQFVGRV